MANLQNLVGGRSHHGGFLHVYLNGLYWGLYFIHERPDTNFMASYYGGESTDCDVFKHDNNVNYQSLQNQLDVHGLVDHLLINF